MNNLRSRYVPLALALVACMLVLSGCGGGKSIAQPKPLTKLPAPSYRMQVMWHSNGGDGDGQYGNGFVPAVAGNRVYTANRDGEVAAFNLASGQRIWRVKLKKHLVSGPGVVGNTLLVGTRAGKLVALSSDNGNVQWQTDLSSETIEPPGGADGVVIVHTVDGHVAAFDLASGDRLWTIDNTVPNLTMRGTSSPVIVDQTVYVGTDSGKVEALNLQTGEQNWSQTVALPDGRTELDRIVDVDADPLIDGNTLYAISVGKSFVAMSRSNGQIRWRQPVAAEDSLAQSNNDLFVSDLDSVVWAVAKSNGKTLWKNNDFQYRQLSAPAVLDGNVLVGDYEGYLHWLSANDGHEIARGRPFGEAIRVRPVVVDGNSAIVLGADGDLARIRFVPNGS